MQQLMMILGSSRIPKVTRFIQQDPSSSSSRLKFLLKASSAFDRICWTYHYKVLGATAFVTFSTDILWLIATGIGPAMHTGVGRRRRWRVGLLT